MFQIVVDEQKCTGCKKCGEVCPKGGKIWGYQSKNGKFVAAVIEPFYCLNCGTCVAFCPTGAIKIEW